MVASMHVAGRKVYSTARSSAVVRTKEKQGGIKPAARLHDVAAGSVGMSFFLFPSLFFVPG